MLRRHEVLKAIIQEFVQTGEPVGSNTILIGYKFSVSPATIRNDMMELEDERLIFQPHTSAGRVPTTQGYRLYLTEMADFKEAMTRARRTLQKISCVYEDQKAREKTYNAVSLLARAAENVSFATLPDNNRTFYLGAAYVFRKPEFLEDPFAASQVMEVFENNDRFVNTLKSFDLRGKTPKAFIGEENMFPQFKSCSIVVTPYRFQNYKGFLGVFGPIRMDYPYTMALVEEVKNML